MTLVISEAFLQQERSTTTEIKSMTEIAQNQSKTLFKDSFEFCVVSELGVSFKQRCEP